MVGYRRRSALPGTVAAVAVGCAGMFEVSLPEPVTLIIRDWPEPAT
jgi:hypothetical protein